MSLSSNDTLMYYYINIKWSVWLPSRPLYYNFTIYFLLVCVPLHLVNSPWLMDGSF